MFNCGKEVGEKSTPGSSSDSSPHPAKPMTSKDTVASAIPESCSPRPTISGGSSVCSPTPCPPPVARAVSSSPRNQARLMDSAKTLMTHMDQHFEDNSTHLKAAIYHLHKNEPREVAQILEKILRLNKAKQQQIAFHFHSLTMRSAGLQQKVNDLQNREKFLLQSSAKMQQKLENFDLAFDEDMTPPEPKKVKKTTAKMQQKLENFDLAFDEDMTPPEPKKVKKTLFETQEEKDD